MTLSEDAFVAEMQALLPPGKAWKGPLIVDVLRGLAPELARVQLRADALLLEMNPGEATELLPEHESTYGITPPPGATVAQRRAALLAKIQETAGHNPADYTAFAAAYGHPGAAITRAPLRPLRAGFRGGVRSRRVPWAHVYFVAYMTQLIVEQANNVAAWSKTAGITSTANFAVAPDGTQTADRISFTGFGILSTFCALSTPSSLTQFSIWLRVPTGTQLITVEVKNSVTSGTDFTFFEVGSRWTRYVVRSSLAGANIVSVSVGTQFELHAWGAYAGKVDTIFEQAFMQRQQAHAEPMFRVIGDDLKRD